MAKRLTVALLATVLLSPWGCAENGDEIVDLIFPPTGVGVGSGSGQSTGQGFELGQNVPDLADVFVTPPGQVGGSTQTAPDGEPVVVNVVNASNQSATVNLDFFLQPPPPSPRVQSGVNGLRQIGSGGLVHRTMLQLRAGGPPVDVGPVRVNLVRASAELADGTALGDTLYRLGIEFESATTLRFRVPDPFATEPPAGQDTPTEPDPDPIDDIDEPDENTPETGPEEDDPIDDNANGGGGGGTDPDCNRNDIADVTDIGSQTSADVNGNGIPDECEFFPPTNECFPISLDSIVRVDEPAGAGRIELPGGFDCFTFDAPPGQAVGFDVLSVEAVQESFCVTPFIRWQCTNGADDFVFVPQIMSHFTPSIERVLTLGGQYTIRVQSDGIATGTYSFEVLATEQQEPVINEFAIALGDTVAFDVPGAGAGNIENDNSRDVYTFAAAEGEMVYFDVLSPTFFGINWDCVDEDGAFVFNRALASFSDPGLLELTRGGSYTITVQGNVGLYSFELLIPPTPDAFPITLDDVVGPGSIDGEPAVGAGELEAVASRDVYTLNVEQGQEVYFDAQSRSTFGMVWTCVDVNGVAVFSNTSFDPIFDPGVRILTLGGDYTITVQHPLGVSGTYGFQVLSLPRANETFDLSLNEIVLNGFVGELATPGAGFLENPASRDVYTFSTDQGVTVYFDALSNDSSSFGWQCEQPDVETVFPPQQFNPFDDPPSILGNDGRLTLVHGGNYQVTVFSQGGVGGAYSFQVVSAPLLPDPSPIALDATVPVTAGGPGELHLFNFTAPVAGDVYFDIPLSSDFDLVWKCDPTGDALPGFNSQFFNGGLEPGRRSLSPDEDYLITLYSRSGTPLSAHQFAVLDLTDPVDAFSIFIPAEVSQDTISGEEALGAGNIEKPGFMDTYTFAPEMDQYAYFLNDGANTGAVTWQATGPNGTVFGPRTFFSPDPGLFLLMGDHNYTIEVEVPSGSDTATYGFAVLTPPVDEFSIDIGDTIDLDIPASGAGRLDAEFLASDVFTFTTVSFVDVVFDPLDVSTSNVFWKCLDPNGQVVFGPQSMAFSGPTRRALFTPGAHTLIVYNNNANDESYSFDLRVINDDCDGINCVFDGFIGFDNTHATSDDLSQCAVENDLWYEYVASCTGDLTVNTCDTDFDTVLAIYTGCDCPSEDLLACNDDSCSLQSEVTVPVTAGDCFKIRVGGFEGDEEIGAGILSIRCFDPNDER